LAHYLINTYNNTSAILLSLFKIRQADVIQSIIRSRLDVYIDFEISYDLHQNCPWAWAL